MSIDKRVRNAGSLRVGLLAPRSLRYWQEAVVEALAAVPSINIALLVLESEQLDPVPNRTTDGLRTAIWDIYNNRVVAGCARSLERVGLGCLGDVPTITCEVEKRGKWSEYFSDKDLAMIRSFDLDVLIRFGFGIIRGGILESATHGVWSFHHDDDEVVRGGPPAFWEIVDGEPVTGAVLQRLTDRLDGGYVLHKGWFRTSKSSYVTNTDTVHMGAVDWPARICRQILAGDEQVAVGVKSASTAPIRRKPRNKQAIQFLGGQAVRWATSQARALTTADQWEVGIVRAPIQSFLDESFVPDLEWLNLAEDRHTYAADPFLITLDGRRQVLYERFDQRRRTGEIWSHDLTTRISRPAGIPLGVHGSYPYVLDAGDEVHCVPQVAGRPARLYTWRSGTWVPGPVVGPDEPVLDATIFPHEGRWWMFATRPGEWSLTHLHAWWAKDLQGPWHPHMLNPVKSDVRSARPGGTPFVHEGRLFRPAQDGSRRYGGSLAIAQVDQLTPERFSERVVRRIRPDVRWPFSQGLHTLSGAGDLTLVDAKRTRFSASEGRVELAARIGKLTRRNR